MGKVVEKKKKKGRPSLLDLQKRSIKQQQEQTPHPKRNPNPKFGTTTGTRRSTRRNPNPDDASPEGKSDGDEEEDDDLSGKRREKKLKLVLKLPNQRSSANSGSYGSDSNAEEGEEGETNHKRLKINAIGAGSTEKEQKPEVVSNPSKTLQGSGSDVGPSTPLPDKKLLVFILDRLQKKDTYSVFSEPVDLKELPDYQEVIEHPMDFGTVRKKLGSGAYKTLEQFEKDVYLISSNAMQYNAPDTIYFRQARSIQELAKKNFENLRQDSDENNNYNNKNNNEQPAEPKVVRRGRPPTKHLKPVGRPALDRAGPEFSSDAATLATGGENTNWSTYDLRRGVLPPDKFVPGDPSSRFLNGSRNSEAYAADPKVGRNDDFTGSAMRGNSMRFGKKAIVFDESRRNTYKQSLSSGSGRDPSVLATFGAERKQLLAVGIHSEHGFARSLARFAANLGPVAWKVASKKIERSLPLGVKFGPGWVGEEEAALPPRLPVPTPGPVSVPLLQPTPPLADVPSVVEPEGDESPGKSEGESSPENQVASAPTTTATMATSTPDPTITEKVSEPITETPEAARGLNSNSPGGAMRPVPPFQIHPGMNGFHGAYGFNNPAQIAGPGPAPTGLNTASKTSTTNTEDPKLLENTRVGIHSQPSWQGPPRTQKGDLGAPDLNVRFQSSGSPSSSSRVESGSGSGSGSAQPDLALQL